MYKICVAFCCLLLVSSGAFAQGDRGTITGTVSDPAGGIIARASIKATNTETGLTYESVTTETGNYTLAQLPVGVYQISCSFTGFKQFIRTGITVSVAQTSRIDISLEMGELTETVMVSADAPLLKTESGEMSQTIKSDTLDDLPILSVSGGLRNPFNVAQLLPSATTSGALRVNGTPGNTMQLRIEGQDATQTTWTTAYSMSQPSVDSIEEYAIQTSNFAAEYGQAGSSVFNLTMKSGTNQIHGSAFDYFRNEALNANTPFVNRKSTDRRHNYGFTFGGPVYLPKLYDGRDKTFFYFSFEQYRYSTINSTTWRTVPTDAYRAGDFSYLQSANRVLGTDVLGRPIIEGTIYDPRTTRTEVVDGESYVVRDPFPNNTIPPELFDPVALKMQDLIPRAQLDTPRYNYNPVYPSTSIRYIPSLKIDHQLTPKMKLSGFWSYNNSCGEGSDGYDTEITNYRQICYTTTTARFNIDYTISPTMLFHFGGGHYRYIFSDDVPNRNFDSLQELGLPGTYATIFPAVWGLYTSQGGKDNTSGQSSMGPVAQGPIENVKPTATTSLTWVKGNHTYKFGAEMRLDSYPSTIETPANGWFYITPIETGLPYLNTTNIGGGSIGFSYASFLLGAVNAGEIGQISRFHMGKSAWALFAQDSWKITRRLTLDYGLRWDYQTYLRETYGRAKSFGPDTPNPRAGGLPGAVIFEATYGPFAKNYKYAFGPRLGLAYQITPKTVLRAGWGISYGQTAHLEMESLRFGSQVSYASDTYGEPVTYLKDGPPLVPVWPDFDPGQLPFAAGDPFLTHVDHNAGRPPRLMMWSIGIQREITTNMSLEATYVGNRGVWWAAAANVDLNRLTPQILADHGLDMNNADDRALLITPLNNLSPEDQVRFPVPYAGYPTTKTVAESLRPYPQFGGIRNLWAPLGSSWYDALQMRLTKRYSHGLELNASYTWSKELTIGAEVQDPMFFTVEPVVNDLTNLKSNKYLSGFSTPHRLVISGTYTTPSLNNVNRFLSWALRDWRIGAVLQYSSGRPIRVPAAQTNPNLASLWQLCQPVAVTGGCNGAQAPGPSYPSFANRVPGEPLFTVDPNSDYDPRTTFLLNPDAWEDPAPGQFGTSTAYYDDYRYARTPSEAMSLGRLFRFKEGYSLQIRAEFSNIFNRTMPINPSRDNASSTQQRDSGGNTLRGFGYMNVMGARGARSGQIVIHFKF